MKIKIDPNKIRMKIKRLACTLNGEYRINRSGVPTIIKKVKDGLTYSIVFVAREDKWKMFFPFPAPAEKQERMYFDTLQEVVEFFK